jgi:hypothetical protein
MLKHLVHSHHGKLHTFDDFYRNDSKSIKSHSPSTEIISTNYSSQSPTSPSSPNSNSYTFYNVFSDFKCPSTTPDVVIEEEDETEEEEDNQIKQESIPPTPLFYLEDDHHPSPPSTSSSPHWPSLILNRFRHSNNHHGLVKQISVNENQMCSNKLRRSDLTDSSITKHRFLKRSETINNTNRIIEKNLQMMIFPNYLLR